MQCRLVQCDRETVEQHVRSKSPEFQCEEITPFKGRFNRGQIFIYPFVPMGNDRRVQDGILNVCQAFIAAE